MATHVAELPPDCLRPASVASMDFSGDFGNVSMYGGASVVTTEGW
jgi:hypothetical protein